MTTKQTAHVYITNNTGGNALIQMSHQYTSYSAQTGSWNAFPGERVGPLTVNYETGFGTGFDYWFCSVSVSDGPNPGIYTTEGTLTNPKKECMLEDKDANQYIYNSVDTEKFYINLPSGGCSTDMKYVGPYAPITNVFVLMLENHSFDHLFGFSGITGVNGLTGNESNTYNGTTYTVSSTAIDPVPTGPGHEFLDTLEQLCGAGTPNPYATNSAAKYPAQNNSGFVANYEANGAAVANLGDVMHSCSSTDYVPVLHQLATEFAICDQWYSSLPGPTWPNRLFAMGGSSAGLDDSPSSSKIFEWESVDGFKYENGSFFDLLDSNKLKYRLYNDFGNDFAGNPNYEGGQFAIVSALNNIQIWDVHHIDDFPKEVADNYPYQYTWIEPNYGDAGGDFHGGSSQHPTDSLAAGERMISYVYNAIRNSRLWNTSMLIITYDEHGGFYDHVAPPAAVEPGDKFADGLNTNGFTFNQYGVRVPAVVVSPLIAKGTVSHTEYDHTSIMKTMENLYNLDPLTERDKGANDLMGLVTLTTPRTDCPLSVTPVAVISGPPMAAESKNTSQLDARTLPESGNVIGFLHIALKSEIAMSDGSDAAKQAIIDNFKANVKTHGDAREYFKRIGAAAEAVRASKKAEG